MSNSVLALLGFAGWTLLLVLTTITLRSWIFLINRRASAEFKPDGSDVSPFHMRLCRAHANCVENLPIFGVIVLTAIVTGHSEVTDALALWVLLARIGQSLTHLLSTSNLAITVRVTFFSVQLAIEAYWAIELVKIALGSQ
ncbi:MAG: MAPEG family protein [Polyangiales bacterium]